MDIKQEIVNRAPTLRSSRAIWFLLLASPAACALAAFLNPITLGLDSKELALFQIGLVLVMLFCTSLCLNYHFYRWSKIVTQFHNEIAPLIANAIFEGVKEVTEKLLAAKSKHEIIAILKSYEKQT